MYLKSLRLENFRSYERAALHFSEHLTILAGGNNAGKSNVLEAIRLLTAPIDGKRTRFAERDDIRRGGTTDFRIIGEFAGLDELQRGLFITALGEPTSTTATYGLHYSAAANRSRRGTLKFWAGPREGGEPEPEARELIRHVHLPALRDAQRELASGSPERIAFLLRHLAGEDEAIVNDLENKATEAFSSLEKHPLLQQTQREVSSGLRELTTGLQSHQATLGFGKSSLRRLARDLRFFLHRQGLAPEDLSESGLGYANLLYIAAVLVELNAARDAELTLFLVEEPEAHLHPQLQALTLEYLREQAIQSAQRQSSASQPQGMIQVIVTTHSPHLTTAVPCRNVIVLHSSKPAPDRQTQGSTSAQLSPSGDQIHSKTPSSIETQHAIPATAAISVGRLEVADEILQKIDRYLDVTRSAMLFSRRILLVEGLAEALLLPTIAAKCVFTSAQDRTALAKFRAATLVPIGGIDFEPYLRILLTPQGGHRLAEKVVILTDEEPSGAGNDRAARLSKIAKNLGAHQQLDIVLTRPATLEAAIFSSNERLMEEIFLEFHPKSQGRWHEEIQKTPQRERANAFAQLFNSGNLRKGDFAQRIANRIQAGETFKVPPSLEQAIRQIVSDSIEDERL